jgi:hypothetical protein
MRYEKNNWSLVFSVTCVITAHAVLQLVRNTAKKPSGYHEVPVKFLQTENVALSWR